MSVREAVARWWPVAGPVAAAVVLVLTWGRSPSGVVVALVALLLVVAILSAVHHAEAVAHRVGEPFGSLVLAVAVTVIEVGLIVTLMASTSGDKSATLARDTVFAAVMITCNGIVGLSLLVATLRDRFADFNAAGTGALLGHRHDLATLSLVLPTFTTSVPGPQFSASQLAFAAVSSLALYGLFVFVQTVRHREDFLPVADAAETDGLDRTRRRRHRDGAAAEPTADGLTAPGCCSWSRWSRWWGWRKTVSPDDRGPACAAPVCRCRWSVS